MSDSKLQLQKPIITPSAIRQIADGVFIIPDSNHIPLVPNIGIIVGSKVTLIIDTGLGTENARLVLEEAKKISTGNPIYLTHTHCHPEHGFGANVISDEVTIVYNETQWNELQEKGTILLKMFRDLILPFAPMLKDVAFTKPNLLYTNRLQLDLGNGIKIELQELGGGHSRGDQAIIVHSNQTVLFTGDLVEEGYFGVLGDNEAHVLPWLNCLEKLEQLPNDIVVPGHGNIGGKERITDFKTYLLIAWNRSKQFRSDGRLSEAEIVENVTNELLTLYPEWGNQIWAKKSGRRLFMEGKTINTYSSNE